MTVGVVVVRAIVEEKVISRSVSVVPLPTSPHCPKGKQKTHFYHVYY